MHVCTYTLLYCTHTTVPVCSTLHHNVRGRGGGGEMAAEQERERPAFFFSF